MISAHTARFLSKLNKKASSKIGLLRWHDGKICQRSCLFGRQDCRNACKLNASGDIPISYIAVMLCCNDVKARSALRIVCCNNVTVISTPESFAAAM